MTNPEADMGKHTVQKTWWFGLHPKWHIAVILTLVAAVAIATGAFIFRSQTTSAGATLANPFATNSPFNTTIAGNAQIDPASQAMIARATRDGRVYASTLEFGIPIYGADRRTPRYTVNCTITYWGPCPFAGKQVPIPNGARPHSGSDGAMVVVDQGDNKIYEFWQARNSGGKWTASFGAVNPLNGSGWGGASTGSGASRLGGVVRIAEIERGSIQHALVVQSDNICARIFRSPAIKTDGNSTRADCLPEGARLRLDPTLNLNTLQLTPGERTVARALQQYGAYVIDIGGSPLSMSFELDTRAPAGSIGQVYERAGFRWDYDGMSAIPWKRLQVIR
ncbi:hypothetical protein [Williamsia sp. 1138]|uniref:hypothetical protein n=1 Tax=Williamsia sp. 1138 TaxID=1903117 RepID=UPI001FEF918C|nr:hypothetical protein [Williamsia sp. 1138]